MYKEIVMKRKISTIFVIIMILAISIVISDMICNITYEEYELGKYLAIFVAIGDLLFTIKEIQKCTLKYKYSIIADEFIIHKVKGNRQNTMENVRIKDIECIKKIGLSKVYLDTIRYKVYGCLNFNSNLYFCRYNAEKGSKVFCFEASSDLINRLDKMRSKK